MFAGFKCALHGCESAGVLPTSSWNLNATKLGGHPVSTAEPDNNPAKDVEIELHMAHFQLGSFLIGLVSNWARFELHSFLMICRTRKDKR